MKSNRKELCVALLAALGLAAPFLCGVASGRAEIPSSTDALLPAPVLPAEAEARDRRVELPPRRIASATADAERLASGIIRLPPR